MSPPLREHVSPDGFVRIRHVGFLANRCRKQRIAQARLLLCGLQQTSDKPLEDVAEACASNELSAVDNNTDADETAGAEAPNCGERCPKCNKGRMRPAEGFGPQSTSVYQRKVSMRCDTS